MSSPMKISVSKRKLLLAFFSIALICSLASGSIMYVVAQGGSTPITISSGIYPGAATYTIWADSGTYYSKNAYGVVSSSIDASSLIQPILNSMVNGGTLFFKIANYTLNTVLSVSNYGVIFRGENHPGAEEPIVNFVAGAAISDMIIFNSNRESDYSYTVKDITFDGANKGCDGLTFLQGAYISVEDCRILRCVNGLSLNGTAKSNFVNMRLEDNTRNLVLVDDNNINLPPNALLFTRCDFIDSTEYGIYAVPTGAFTNGYVTFKNCLIESNHKFGAYLYNSNWFSFENCLFEANNKDVAGNIDDLHIEEATERNGFVLMLGTLYSFLG
jgi:hypothetical protein